MFVQIIEGQTNDREGLERQGDRWDAKVRPGAIGFLGVTSGVAADGHAISVVRFESEEAAQQNSDRPEQSAWWEETAKLFDGDVSFTQSSDVQLFMGGGSNDAGFVQIMKSSGIDRGRLAKLDEAFEKLAHLRPDLIGGLRVWTGEDSCVEVNYFTSEAEARKGESQEMPPEAQALMAEFGDMMQNTEYIDLSDPFLR
jgi:hypothetical protein